jgi:tetratricopeptide (TPR) repeat protein
LFALVFVVVGSSAHAQMNMLPQLFRDLPPELQQGLPPSMDYEEYMDMTRNVDFFSMFMAIWVPGYALFGVEEPKLGWTVAGVRAGGLAMIITGFARQWQDLNDFWRLRAIADTPDRYRRAVSNMVLIGGGFFINGVAWAFDVAMAYRIAQNDKSFVQYKYGVQARLEGSPREKHEEYIRSLARQSGPMVAEDLEASLRRYLRTYPESDFVAEAEYQLGTLLATQRRDAQALLVLLRQMTVHPDSRLSPASRRTAAMLVQRNRDAWQRDRDTLLELVAAAPEATHGGFNGARPGGTGPGGADAPAAETAAPGVPPRVTAGRFDAFLEDIAALEAEVFKELYVTEARAFLAQYPASPIADRVLFTQAAHLEELGRREEAIIAYTKLAAAHAGSQLWPEAMLRIGDNLDQLGERGYAHRFYERLVDRAPQSRQAAEARRRMEAR